ncbi:MAG TPA: hypothetical protein VFY43_07405 [Candidatus Limnocylindria bacterium]|nr:hypothetical protein [Candidatus Limnocylindria bacterium]
MNIEQWIGFLIIGIAIIGVLFVVFAVTIRVGRQRPRPTPPPGVHLPPGSLLPVIFSLGAALLGAALVFMPDEPYALPVLDAISRFMNPWLGLAGLLVLIYGIVAWVRAAGNEWQEVEESAHHDGAGH